MASVALAAGAIFIDSRLAERLEDFPILLGTTVGGGRAIATAVAGATITVAAIVFSITALSTQMASSQYSPRTLGGFFEDTFQQVIIGLVVGTFTYSLVILAGLSDVLDDPTGPTPSASITLTIVLGVASAIGIVAYINHSLKRMQVDSVVRRIARSSLEAIRNDLNQAGEGEIPEGKQPQGEPANVIADRGGWVVAIERTQLLNALPPGTTARVDVRVGEAVSEGDHIVTLWPDPGDQPSLLRAVKRSIRTAAERSLKTDPTFGVRQLVDIGLRALSPGVNDPSTAVDVIHNLKTPIREVLMSDPPRRVFTGAGDRRVFLAETPSRTDYIHGAFSEIRLAAAGQPYVLSALIEVLEDLLRELEGADLEGRSGAVRQELELTVESARKSDLPQPDLDRILDSRKNTEDSNK